MHTKYTLQIGRPGMRTPLSQVGGIQALLGRSFLYTTSAPIQWITCTIYLAIHIIFFHHLADMKKALTFFTLAFLITPLLATVTVLLSFDPSRVVVGANEDARKSLFAEDGEFEARLYTGLGGVNLRGAGRRRGRVRGQGWVRV